MAKGVKTGGRQKGSPNKLTLEFRETVRKLLEDNAGNIALWLGRVAKEDPNAALDKVVRLAEFAAPKLARTEVTGKDGEAVQFERIERVIVDPK